MAFSVAAARVEQSSLRKMLSTWVLAVLGLKASFRATWRHVLRGKARLRPLVGLRLGASAERTLRKTRVGAIRKAGLRLVRSGPSGSKAPRDGRWAGRWTPELSLGRGTAATGDDLDSNIEEDRVPGGSADDE